MAIHLGTSVTELPGIGPKAAGDFQRLGIVSVRDLLMHIPYRYEDFSVSKPIPALNHEDTVTLIAIVKSISSRKSQSGRVTLTEAVLENETGKLNTLWFNQPYLEKRLRPGTTWSFAGRIDRKFGKTTFMNPIHEGVGENINTGRLLPIYSLSGSLTLRRLREAIESALEAVSEWIDWVPADICSEERLVKTGEALHSLHTPFQWSDIERGRKRLAFDELFLRHLLFGQIRLDRCRNRTISIDIDIEGLKTFVSNLPFTLTDDQRRAAWQIVQDLAKDEPMNRLLQGDVGSGKTVVAAIAAHGVIAAGKQVAYLAPTEILAVQQHTSLTRLFPAESVGLFTRSHAMIGSEEVGKETFLEQLREGEIRCVVGTHALIQDRVSFAKNALVVIDEQQRFGVAQRHLLLDQGAKTVPHLLSMTATPIPRSLALTFHGDLEVSLIRELPKGRQPIKTILLRSGGEDELYTCIRKEVAVGRQAYIVCPMIDPSDQLGGESVKELAKRLAAGPLKGLQIGMLHGQLKSDEKDEIMHAFAAGQIQILVSTTVVEVGVDVPNASVMAIMGAERFGLSQLHQLRGRVGRGSHSSFCFLSPTVLTPQAEERLQAVVETQDGFSLAQKDLELRGSGNVFGTVQSGFSDFRFVEPITDSELMEHARNWAEKLFTEDPDLEKHPLIKEKITASFDEVHLE